VTVTALKVRIGIGLGVHQMIDDRAGLLSLCRAVEDAGFDSLWLSEVIASHSLDPVAALSFAAAVTSRLKLGTSVLVAAGRPPALLAKTMATLDLLAGGRFLPIIGLGTVHDDEQQAFNISRADRGSWLDEAVPVIRRLWTEDAVVHHGRRFHLDGLSLPLRPARPLPIWLGGRGRHELARVGRLGDGWLASFATPGEIGAGIETVRSAAATAGRSIDDDHYGVLLLYALRGPTPQTAEFLRWRRPDLTLDQALPVGAAAIRQRLADYVGAGASKFILVPAERPPDWRAELAELADAVLPLQTPADGAAAAVARVAVPAVARGGASSAAPGLVPAERRAV
jgi:probable F420-dependent oxidoreductase